MYRKSAAGLAAVVGVVVAGLLFAAAARAAEFEPIDCGETSLGFDKKGYDGYEVACKQLAYTGSDTIGERDYELAVNDPRHGAYIDLVDVRLSGGYYPRAGIMRDLTNYYDDTFQNDWEEVGRKSGYDMAHYRGEDDGGDTTTCIAFRRYVSFTQGGVNRLVVGHGCSPSTERVHLYEMLDAVTAPGG